jgi:myo-inositol-1(or 4)-monophosphatase
MDADQLLQTALSAARRGADVLLAHRGQVSGVREKGRANLVTAADTASEAVIIETIRQVFPDHSILAEESGADGVGSTWRWIIDPLDGTTNFAHGLDLFCISIAAARAEEVLAAVVFNPVSGELFTAARQRGAHLNGRPIRASATGTVANSLLVTGFPYDFREISDAVMARFGRCAQAAQGIRRLGAAALDLCFVACGRFDGYWEQNLQPWDTAAGILIAREAGCRVTDFGGIPVALESPQILATNGTIHQELMALLAQQGPAKNRRLSAPDIRGEE